MKYKCDFPLSLSSEALEHDAAGALVVGDAGNVRLGGHGLYSSQFLTRTFVPYSEMVQAYLRLEQSSTRLGCRLVPADYVYLMLLCSDSKLRKFLIPSRELGDRALKHIAEHNPAVVIGYQSTPTV